VAARDRLGADRAMSVSPAQARAFERCVAAGGVAVFPADTVYGLACDPCSPAAVARLYELKGRPPGKPAAVMFFAVERALAALPELGPHTRRALLALLPGAVTVLLANPRHRFALACGPDRDTLGLRVPALAAPIAALAAVRTAVLQSSANPSGGPDPRTLDAVAAAIRDGADLVLDGGGLPGVPSTVLDLRAYEDGGRWSVPRAGAVGRDALAAVLVPAAGRRPPDR
jgi:L-threonylcarbamoyladenylate synthase